MSVEKTLEKLLRGESDANIRFNDVPIRPVKSQRVATVFVDFHHGFVAEARGFQPERLATSASAKFQ